MSDEQEHVDAGSEAPSEAATPAPEPSPAPEPAPASNAGDAVEQKAGDACTCPDGRVGTLHANEDGTFTCIPNEG